MVVSVFLFFIFGILGLQLWKGVLSAKRCYNTVSNTWVNNGTSFCGYRDCDANEICKDYGENPHFGFTSFDNLFYSFLVIFQVITMENWGEILFMLQDAFHPLCFLYFVLLIICGSWFLLNLALAVINYKYSLITHNRPIEKPGSFLSDIKDKVRKFFSKPIFVKL